MIRLKDTLLVLARHRVGFVIVGGIAATLHGSVHQTFDLDICYSRDLANLDRLVAALSPYAPTLRGAPGRCLRQHRRVHASQAGRGFSCRRA